MNLSSKIAIDIKLKIRKMKIYDLLNYKIYAIILDNLYANEDFESLEEWIDYYRFIVKGIKDGK